MFDFTDCLVPEDTPCFGEVGYQGDYPQPLEYPCNCIECLRQYYKPCTPDIEFVQCGCGAVWARNPYEDWLEKAGWCPNCGQYSTWDVDMEFLLEQESCKCISA